MGRKGCERLRRREVPILSWNNQSAQFLTPGEQNSPPPTHPQYIIQQRPSPRTQLYNPHPPYSPLRNPFGDQEQSQQFPKDLGDLGRSDEIPRETEWVCWWGL